MAGMCGRFTQHLSWQEIVDLYNITRDVPALNIRARYNFAPTQDGAACRLDDGGDREIVKLRWGLVPFWAKDEKIAYKTINARAETVADKPAFRAAFRARRCLIPVNGWYEWKKHGTDKQPYLITRDEPFSFAGLWERWNKGDEPVETYTIVTTAAADEISDLHGRMPVVVPTNRYGTWLAPDTDKDDLLGVLDDAVSTGFKFWPVSKDVGSPRNDRADLLEPEEVP